MHNQKIINKILKVQKCWEEAAGVGKHRVTHPAAGPAHGCRFPIELGPCSFWLGRAMRQTLGVLGHGGSERASRVQASARPGSGSGGGIGLCWVLAKLSSSERSPGARGPGSRRTEGTAGGGQKATWASTLASETSRCTLCNETRSAGRTACL